MMQKLNPGCENLKKTLQSEWIHEQEDQESFQFRIFEYTSVVVTTTPL